ncbi:MAG: ERAP1-like C-terminal domain-containing protein [Acidobacteriota bacterium]|nr:ERAP1-like C-terminal domain-containing protein [Acidobacteriota bacterium]
MSFSKFLALSAILLNLVCAPALLRADQPPELRLPTGVTPTSYQVSLKLDPDSQTFSGSVAIKVDIKQPVQTIWLNATKLDVANASLKAGGKTLVAKAAPSGDDFVGLTFDSPVPAGPAEIAIAYTGHIRQGNSSGVFGMEDKGNKYLFTQFEQIDARAAFPCFDEPSYKVPWQLTLDVPEQDDAVSNTPVLKQDARDGRKIVQFKQTKPLPSYLVAFAVGQFDFVPAGYAGKNRAPIRIVTPKGHAAEAKYAAEVTATILTRLEDYFGIPFPYEKSDQVAIPVTFGFGAMENAGMVTYAQNILLSKPETDTTSRQRECASVEAHELAHQWFGDLVTTAWWNDIWLNEAFATWMEQHLLADWKPEWQTRAEDVDSKLGAEAQDSLVSARKIRQEIKTKDDISNAFDSITYNKGASVIGMFENYVGPAQFRQGVQSYLKRYAFGNATAPEFLDSVSSAIKKDINKPFSTFLNQAGVPLVSVTLQCSGGTPSLRMEQERSLPIGSPGSKDQVWQIPVCVRYGAGEHGQSACTLMTEQKTDWTLKGNGCPAWVEGNDNAVGYYRIAYKGNLLSALTEGDMQNRLSTPERVDLAGNTQALSHSTQLSVAEALSLVPKFKDDTSRFVVERAVTLASSPREHLVPEDLIPNYQRFVLKNFQARAEQLGWTPKPNESDDVRLLRPNLLPAVAVDGHDEALAKQARELTDKWFENRNAIDPNLTSAVLDTAAAFGDKALADHFLAEFKKTSDRQERGQIVNALGSFRDKAAIESDMQAVLSGDVPYIEGLRLLFAGQDSPATRDLAFDFMQAHFDEIAAKRPGGGGFDAGSLFPYVGASYCDQQSQEKLKAFFEPRVDKFVGAPRILSQVLESINVCIATKAAQEPGVAEFLKQY